MDEYIVELRTVFTVEGSEDEVRVTCPAQYDYTPARQIINYIDYDEDNEIYTRITVEADHVEIERNGDAVMGLYLSEGELQRGVYTTPFGSIPVEYTTLCIINELGQNGGKLELRYIIDIGGSESHNVITVAVRRTGEAYM